MADEVLGQKVCPLCGAKMVPMSKGNGFRCATPGNRFIGGTWTKCNGVIWNNQRGGGFKPQVVIPRALTYPAIATPTDQQRALKVLHGMAPEARGGRCMIIDAGPGTAKTSTTAWCMEAIFNRLGNLFNYGLRAFNKNAANLLLAKLPPTVGDISTLHSAGKAAQGHKGLANTAKISKAYRGLVEHIEPKDRPPMGKLKAVLERSRALCLYTTEDDKGGWNDIIATVLARFPSLAKKSKGQEKHLSDYLPTLAAVTLNDGRTMDFSDMITRPVMLACAKTGWRMPCELALKSAQEWTEEDINHFAKLVRAIQLPPMKGLVIDEAQDLDLSQIAVILAHTWKSGELTLIGDDRCGNPGDDGWKAGQAIYGWRGAFSGSLTLISRLWEALTGETAVHKALTVTFRHGETICESYRALNSVIEPAPSAPDGEAYQVGMGQAFSAWIDLPAMATALWITRTNAAAAPILLETIRNHADCTIRGGEDFAGAITTALYEAAGWADEVTGEYRTSLPDALDNLRKIVAENAAESGEVDPNSLEAFCLEIGEAITQQPELLDKAKIVDRGLTVGNLRRFISYFADKDSRRVITTVYRCKGDEADLAIVGDAMKFNESWGNPEEDDACRHVALSRAKRLSLTVGSIVGSGAKPCTDETDFGELLQTA